MNMAFKPNLNKKIIKQKKILAKPKQNKGVYEKKDNPFENKITLEHNNTVDKHTWGQIAKEIITYLLPLIILFFLSWLMFYKIVPQIGSAISQGGAKVVSYTKDKAHDIKNCFYNRFKEWNCPEWLAKTGSILTPILIGLAIAICCLFIPIIGPALCAVVGLGTLIMGSFMIFTDETVPPTPKENIVVIENNGDKTKETKAKTDPTKNLNQN
jgi:hypothetical protein